MEFSYPSLLSGDDLGTGRVDREPHQFSLPLCGLPRKYLPASHLPFSQDWLWWCLSSLNLEWSTVNPKHKALRSGYCRYAHETSCCWELGLSVGSISCGEAVSVKGLPPHWLSWSDSDLSVWNPEYCKIWQINTFIGIKPYFGLVIYIFLLFSWIQILDKIIEVWVDWPIIPLCHLQIHGFAIVLKPPA